MPHIPIGERLYLFTKGPDPGKYSNQLVISAHGGISRTATATEKVPHGVTLLFYSKHGEATVDKGIQGFAQPGREKQLAETLGPGDFYFNYSLSKYQGYHGAGVFKPVVESYGGVQNATDYVDEWNTMVEGAISKGIQGHSKMEDFDALTVRNRWSAAIKDSAEKGDVTLSFVLERVLKVHPYSNVHCYFCRSF